MPCELAPVSTKSLARTTDWSTSEIVVTEGWDWIASAIESAAEKPKRARRPHRSRPGWALACIRHHQSNSNPGEQ